MKCVIFESEKFIYDGDISCRCTKCNILNNLQAKELDYSDDSGQDIPSAVTSKIRI